jgi:two-component system, response regulator YesN
MKLDQARSVMIVEDDAVFLQTMVQILEMFGFDPVYAAADGEDAWQRLRETPVDLLITDINMPRMNGIELMHHVRQRYSELPIIVISGFLEQEHLSQLEPYRVHATLFKPFKIPQIAGEIRRLFADGEGS